jgi:hypothetical protein
MNDTKLVCTQCGDADIEVLVWAIWDRLKQDWVIVDPYHDDEGWCSNCCDRMPYGEQEFSLKDKAQLAIELNEEVPYDSTSTDSASC